MPSDSSTPRSSATTLPPPTLRPERLELERRKHLSAGTYGVTGHRWKDDVLQLARDRGCRSVLDYGAGKGSLADALADSGLDVRIYDPVTAPEAPEPADLVVCTDVMCFVDSGQVPEVLDHIAALARKAVFFAIPLHPAEKEQEGLTRMSLKWWRDTLDRYWPVRSASTRHWGESSPNASTPRLVFIGRVEER